MSQQQCKVSQHGPGGFAGYRTCPAETYPGATRDQEEPQRGVRLSLASLPQYLKGSLKNVGGSVAPTQLWGSRCSHQRLLSAGAHGWHIGPATRDRVGPSCGCCPALCLWLGTCGCHRAQRAPFSTANFAPENKEPAGLRRSPASTRTGVGPAGPLPRLGCGSNIWRPGVPD